MSIIESKQQEFDRVNNRFIDEVNQRSDRLLELFLWGYYTFGICISLFYDTWLIGLSVGSLVMVAYYLSKFMFPKTSLRHYIMSGGIAIFMGQFIYQMHGLFEMHFFAFIGATLLISYQNWKTLVPLAAIIVAHHAIFGWLQYQSFSTSSANKVYFTQLDYMDLQTFIIHCSLAVIILLICGIWSYDLRKRTRNNTRNIVEIEHLSDVMAKNMEYASALVSDDAVDVVEPKGEGDLMGKMLKEIHLKLKGEMV